MSINFSTWYLHDSADVQTVWIPVLQALEEKSGGRISWTLFDGGALGSGPEHYDLVASGRSDMGYATFTIDQRNQGVVNPETELELFEEGKGPFEYSMVYDALMAAEVLRDQKVVDPENIAMLGISNGGRFAIIATALDPKIKGVIGISTSGYQTGAIDKNRINENAYKFYRSIDPDNYIATISHPKVVLIHAINDAIVPYNMAEVTFELAKAPKAMYTVNGSIHGYSPSAKGELEKELAIIFDQ